MFTSSCIIFKILKTTKTGIIAKKEVNGKNLLSQISKNTYAFLNQQNLNHEAMYLTLTSSYHRRLQNKEILMFPIVQEN
jgi:hypothetical protein